MKVMSVSWAQSIEQKHWKQEETASLALLGGKKKKNNTPSSISNSLITPESATNIHLRILLPNRWC